MRRNGKKLVIGILALALVAFLAGPAFSGDPVTISGTVKADDQIVTDDGKIYVVADTEKGGEVIKMIDKKVKATGTVEEGEGKMKISITEYEVIE